LYSSLGIMAKAGEQAGIKTACMRLWISKQAPMMAHGFAAHRSHGLTRMKTCDVGGFGYY